MLTCVFQAQGGSGLLPRCWAWLLPSFNSPGFRYTFISGLLVLAELCTEIYRLVGQLFIL